MCLYVLRLQLNLLLSLIDQGVGLKSIGKAAMKGTKKIGKTLTAISDSPDKRGQGRMAKVKNPQFHSRENRKDKGKHTKVISDSDLGFDTGKLDLTSDVFLRYHA